LTKKKLSEKNREYAFIRMLLQTYKKGFEPDIPCFAQLLKSGFVTDKISRTF